MHIVGSPEQPKTVEQINDVVAPALLFEMMRSFVTLAKTLNLSHAVADLNSTRQTLRRHIASLEAMKGGALFEVKDRRYSLTALGMEILPQAKKLVIESEAWATGQSKLVNGLQYFKHHEDDGWFLYLQQHPISRAFTSSSDMLPRAIKAWGISGGNLGHEEMREVRPVCNIFRRVQNELVFNEVGADSSFASWFGENRAESCVGLPMGWLPADDGVLHFLNAAYWEIEQTQSLRLDHVYTVLPLGEAGTQTPICYERLMLGAHFPDGSPAIISVVRRTYDIEILGLSETEKRKMPADKLM